MKIPKMLCSASFKKKLKSLRKSWKKVRFPFLLSLYQCLFCLSVNILRYLKLSHEFGSWCKWISWLCLPCSVPGAVSWGQRGARGGQAVWLCPLGGSWHSDKWWLLGCAGVPASPAEQEGSGHSWAWCRELKCTITKGNIFTVWWMHFFGRNMNQI